MKPMITMILLWALFVTSLQADIFEEIDCPTIGREQNTTDTSVKTYQTPSFEEFHSSLDPVEFVEQFSSVEQKRETYELVSEATGEYRVTYVTNEIDDPEAFVLVERVIVPDIIFETDFGTLLGTDRGEWGGELLMVDENRKLAVLAQMNVEDIYQMPFGIIVISGLAHMTFNSGEVSLVEPNLKVSSLFKLVGAPKSSWLLPTGDLLINSYDQGSQVITTDGDMKRVVCRANKALNTDASDAGAG